METTKLEFKGTKGEWKINNYSGNTDCVYSEQTQERIATYHKKNNKGCYSNSSLICESNAKLIADAPDLLEALQTVYNKMNAQNYSENDFDLVEKAIEKALK